MDNIQNGGSRKLRISLTASQTDYPGEFAERIMFEGTGKISLREYFASVIPRDEMKTLLINLACAIGNLDDCVKNIYGLELTMDSVYVDPFDKSVSFSCVISDDDDEPQNYLYQLFKDISENCRVENASDGKDCFQAVWNLTNSENDFSTEGLRSAVASFSEGAEAAEVKTAAPDDKDSSEEKKEAASAPAIGADRSAAEEKRGLFGRLISLRRNSRASASTGGKSPSAESVKPKQEETTASSEPPKSEEKKMPPRTQRPVREQEGQNTPQGQIKPPLSISSRRKPPVTRTEVRSDELMSELPPKSVRSADAAEKKAESKLVIPPPQPAAFEPEFVYPEPGSVKGNTELAAAQFVTPITPGMGLGLDYGPMYNNGMFGMNQAPAPNTPMQQNPVNMPMQQNPVNMPMRQGAGNVPMQTQVVFNGAQYMRPSNPSDPRGDRSIVADRYRRGTPTVAVKYTSDYTKPLAQPGRNTTPTDTAGQTVFLNMPDTAQNRLPFLIRTKFYERIVIDCAYFRIGKDKNSVNYCISDNESVSRNHAYIICKNGRFFVVDNFSTNHTYVDGNMIPGDTEVEIFNGSRIKFADEEYEFVKN